MCLCVLPACISAHLVHAEPEEAAGFPETGVTEGCELPCGC